MVPLPSIGKAKVVDLFAHREEVESGVVADDPQADAGVGPSAPDRFGHAAMIRRHAPGRPAVAQELIEALPRSRPVLAAHPAQAGTNRLADRRER